MSTTDDTRAEQLRAYFDALATGVDAGVPEAPERRRRGIPARALAAAAAVVVVIAGVGVVVLGGEDDPSREIDTGPADPTTSTAPSLGEDDTSLGAPVPGRWVEMPDPLGADDSYAELVWTGDELLGVYPENGGEDVAVVRWDAGLADATLAAPSGHTWRAGPTIVWTGSEVLVMGGSNGPGIEEPVLAYDPADDSWRTLAPPPGFRAPSSEAVLGNDGVWTGEEVLFTRIGLAFDPATEVWRELAPEPADDWAVIADAPDGTIHWGQCPVGLRLARCEDVPSGEDRGVRYSVERDGWEPVPDGGPMPTPHMAVASDDAELFLVATGPGLEPGRIAGAYSYAAGTWRALPDAPRHEFGLTDLLATPLGVVLTGRGAPTVTLPPGADAWRPLGDDAPRFDGAALGLAGDRLVVTGTGRTLRFEEGTGPADCDEAGPSDPVVGSLTVTALPDGFEATGPAEETGTGELDAGGERIVAQTFADAGGRTIEVRDVGSYDPRGYVASTHVGPPDDVDVGLCYGTLEGLRPASTAVAVSTGDGGRTVAGTQLWEYGAFVVEGGPDVTRDEVLQVVAGLQQTS